MSIHVNKFKMILRENANWYSFFRFLRKYSTIKPKVIPDENVFSNIENNIYKPKQHPGIFKPRAIELPEYFIQAVYNVIEDYPLKSLIADGQVLINHLRDKRAPLEHEESKRIKQEVFENVVAQTPVPTINSEENTTKYWQFIRQKVDTVLKHKMYNWKPVNYDAYNSLVYLINRAPAEYAVLAKIFQEISGRDHQFKPRSLFDFGSGVGTASWAAILYWKKHLFEYFNVDSSNDMNELAQTLLQKGRGTNQMSLKGVFYRQFLPANNTSYDLVVSAYTLLELPSRQARLDTVLKLWNKTQKYLVIVENGSNAGFQVINELRDFILHTSNKTEKAHIFSPCPHDSICPRFTQNDGTPCNFEVFYFTIPTGSTKLRCQERYSYVVFRKGERDPLDLQWPRVVRETMVRSKHVICRMCTKNCELEEVIFTASKHGKNLHHCARATKWGDLMPINLEAATKLN